MCEICQQYRCPSACPRDGQETWKRKKRENRDEIVDFRGTELTAKFGKPSLRTEKEKQKSYWVSN